jgi:non-lysosomal glucosylceramidase
MSSNCDSSGCGSVDRRTFLRVFTVSAATLMTGSMPVMAGPFESDQFAQLIPPDKRLHPDWLKSLVERGERATLRGDELKFIGMPIGGLCAGQLYLGGDGTLWYWDIFNKYIFTGYDAVTYVTPRIPTSPIQQGFSIKISQAGKEQTRSLDRNGFHDIAFNGEYPVGFVEYRDTDCPVVVSLEAFSPFIPLNADDSSLPATVMRYTMRNTSAAPVELELTGHLENGASVNSQYIYGALGTRHNRIVRDGALLALECGMTETPLPTPSPLRPAIVFADFEGTDYGAWTTEGEAFGKGPTNDPRVTNFQGKSYANSYPPNGGGIPQGDAPQGTLTSPEFTVERRYINFLMAGGRQLETLAMQLLDDGGNVIRTATGNNTEKMDWQSWDVGDCEGKKVRIRAVDHASGPWGHIEFDQVQFEDEPKQPLQKFALNGDFGTMALALLQAQPGDGGSADGKDRTPSADAPARATDRLVGSLARKVTLQPGETHTANFVIAWHFPNLGHDTQPDDGFRNSEGRSYATRFPDASAVARYVADNFDKLHGQTKAWHDSWYDSTLPWWLLDRTLLNISTLATSTAYHFANGLFYGWEGVGCCAGTCTHVWSYEQAMGRLFPEFDRNLRERVDYKLGAGLRPDGEIGNRSGGDAATDGHAGTILRTYRDHQTSPDDAFLKRNWDAIKLAIGWLIAQDGNSDGILEGPQPNTMDETWYGAVPWLSGMYLGALRAGEEMAHDMGDAAFAQKCRAIFEAGQKNFVQRLWNQDAGYFYQIPDPKNQGPHHGSYTGCEADQVYGQGWAHQVGLGRLLPADKTKQALDSIYKFNFAPDVGPYRKLYGGRWYAMAGEAGLIICTWPQNAGEQGTFNYCNECWAGIEHQVAGHMIWEGMLTEGLAIERAVHDRYHPSRRNPWNEVECGDHYARSMSSYGVFVAVCGFEYHGPRGTMAFAPQLTPENFRSAFTAADGWGTFAQKLDGPAQKASLEMKSGQLTLSSLTLTAINAGVKGDARAMVDGKSVPVTTKWDDSRATIAFANPLTLPMGAKLEIVIG